MLPKTLTPPGLESNRSSLHQTQGGSVNKQIFAKTVTKVVPVIGGVVSGGLTYASLRTGSRRLMKHLKTLPPAFANSASQD